MSRHRIFTRVADLASVLFTLRCLLRTLDSMALPSSSAVRYQRLYFHDGDVVLAAQTSPPTRNHSEPSPLLLFRVHKTTLSHNSTAFANMFADASSSAGETYDGVPLVHLEGDKAEDLALLLAFLYYPV